MPPSETGPRLGFSRAGKVSLWTGVLVVVVGSVVFLGWAFDVTVLKTAIPGVPYTKANTALSFFLLGSSLIVLVNEPRVKARWSTFPVRRSLALLAAVIATLTIAEYALGVDAGIDQLLARDTTAGAAHPGRMPPNTAAGLLMFSAALMFVDLRARRIWVAEVLAIAGTFLGFLAVVWYSFASTELLAFGPFSGMALLTSGMFLALGTGVLAARPHRGLMGTVTRNSPGGILARRVVVAALAIPWIVAWFRLQAEHAGLFDLPFGLSIMVVSAAGLLSITVLITASTLDRQDALRSLAEQSLQKSRDMFHGLFDSAPDAIVVVGEEGQIAQTNARVEQLFGYQPAELLGQPIEVLVPDRLRDRHVTHRRGYVEAPRLRPMGSDLELYGRRMDGSQFPVEITLAPLEGESELLVIATVRDVTERKGMERELQLRARDLERSNAELQQFAYVASHDLQEPLRTVASFVQLLARKYKGKLDDEAEEFINFAVDGSTRMQTLINDLLALSRVGTRGKPFARTACEDVLLQAQANLKTAIDESAATVTHDPLPVVFADAAQLVQVFQNLMGNAIKFRGEAPPRIYVSAEKGGDSWTISVQDNGIGIDPKYFGRLFVVFQRLHNRTEYPGTGIGLAICKKIIERHGGRIWVESRPGQGSTFRFTIPAKRSEKP